MAKLTFEVTPPAGCKVALMMDSGVFSAHNKNDTIDLKIYIDYLKRNKSLLYSYVNVDSIPGKFGVQLTVSQVEKSAQIGYDNLQRMKDAGLSPIPVFHQGEDFKWLIRMIEDGERYIGISTAKDLQAPVQRKWLDRVFTLITDKEGRPLIRTHGFGITNPALLLRYPWFTCDSTTWLYHAAMGQALIPQYEGITRGTDGKYCGGRANFLKKPRSIVLSGVAGNAWDESWRVARSKRQFEKFAYEQREMIEYAIARFLDEYAGGMSIAQARDTHSRRRIILAYYLQLCRQLYDVRFKHDSNSLLLDRQAVNIKPSPRVWNLNIVFVTQCGNKQWSMLLGEMGASARLVSYYDMRTRKDEYLERYVTEGAIGEYHEQVPPAKWDTQRYLSYRSMMLDRRLARPALEE